MTNQTQVQKTRSFLKWAGGKYRVIDTIRPHLPDSNCLVEPFVGSAVLFLNTDYKRYILNDINPDLVNVYQMLQQFTDDFISKTKRYFSQRYNQHDEYYRLRERFNKTNDMIEKAALFIYFNRHGYNGLCRYNQQGGFNVPYGYYTKPYFPQHEMQVFCEKAQRATFSCKPFATIMQRAKPGYVIYCDPPYTPLSPTAKFTSYFSAGFGQVEQTHLAEYAEKMRQKGVTVLISNHDLRETRQTYHEAKLIHFKVQRNISCKGKKRLPVKELLAIYEPFEDFLG